MSEAAKQQPAMGTISWRDLTVPNADQVRDFYQAVVGWKAQPVSMGDYNDYSMLAPNGEGVAGICHARGQNAAIPPQWLMYITVPDVAAAVQACGAHGGSIVAGPHSYGEQKFCVLRDPAGAVFAVFGA